MTDPTIIIDSGDNKVEFRSNTDKFGRIVFDEIQTERGFISREFSYCAGKISKKHIENKRIKSAPTTNLVKQITFCDGRIICYDYDGEDRISKIIDSVEGVIEYTYDTLGQLLTETHNGVLVNFMTYDNYGNILTKNGISYSYDEVWKDKLVSFDNNIISYDEQGNPINYLGHILTWQKGRELATYDDNVYTYNMYGIRASKTVKSVTNGIKVLKETWDNNVMVSLYDDSDCICGIVYNGNAYYFVKNLQNDIIAIANETGETLAQYSYDAWGKPTVLCDDTDCCIATINPYRYRGYYYDIETGLYYLQSRYYDPNIGRFINADDPNYIVETRNLYAYCNNSSVNNVDYLGYCSDPSSILEQAIVNKTDVKIVKVPSVCESVELYFSDFEDIGYSASKITIEEGSESQFLLAWYSIRSSGCGVAIIDCHGAPGYINNSSISCGMTLDSIATLPFANLSLLIILGCNCGHYDHFDSNVGHAFKQKVSCPVICSDGSVVTQEYYPTKFESFDSDTWSGFCNRIIPKRKDNKGWMIYNYKGDSLGRFKSKSLTFKQMFSLI